MRLTRHVEGDAFYRGLEVYECAVCRTIGRLGTLRQAVADEWDLGITRLAIPK